MREFFEKPLGYVLIWRVLSHGLYLICTEVVFRPKNRYNQVLVKMIFNNDKFQEKICFKKMIQELNLGEHLI